MGRRHPVRSAPAESMEKAKTELGRALRRRHGKDDPGEARAFMEEGTTRLLQTAKAPEVDLLHRGRRIDKGSDPRPPVGWKDH